MTASGTAFEASRRRVELLTLGLGAAGSIFAAVWWGWRAAAGLALGTALSWVNYLWLKQGVAAIAQFSTAQADAPKVRIPKLVYVKFSSRFVLLLVVVYVILLRSLLPGSTVLAGLFTVVAAVMVEMIYQLIRNRAAG